MSTLPRDIVPGMEEKTGELMEFVRLMNANWEPQERHNAQQREIHAAAEHLRYLRWLRNPREEWL